MTRSYFFNDIADIVATFIVLPRYKLRKEFSKYKRVIKLINRHTPYVVILKNNSYDDPYEIDWYSIMDIENNKAPKWKKLLYEPNVINILGLYAYLADPTIDTAKNKQLFDLFFEPDHARYSKQVNRYCGIIQNIT